MSPTIIVGLLILLLVIGWVLHPLLLAKQERHQLASDDADQRLENLLFEREAALLAIRDVKFDYDMGKLSQEDFAQLDARYRTHAVQILRELDELGVVPDAAEEPVEDTLDEWIERAVAKVREGNVRPATA